METFSAQSLSSSCCDIETFVFNYIEKNLSDVRCIIDVSHATFLSKRFLTAIKHLKNSALYQNNIF